MFAIPSSRWTARLRAALAVLKAFAMLEEHPRAAIRDTALAGAHQRCIASTNTTIDDNPGLDHGPDVRDTDGGPPHARGVRPSHAHGERPPHAHGRTLVRRPARPRRPGAVRPRPTACTTPLAGRLGHPVPERPQNARWAARRAAHR